jgi:hypothetical protein
MASIPILSYCKYYDLGKPAAYYQKGRLESPRFDETLSRNYLNN